MKKITKYLALIMCLVMAACVFPVSAVADDGDPPMSISFGSYSELVGFAGNNDFSEEYRSAFVLKHPEAASFTKEQLQGIAAKMGDCLFPDAELFGADFEECGATYYNDRNELDVVYTVNDVRHRFIYSFDKPIYSDGKPAFGTYIFDGVTFDMHTDDDGFVGSVKTEYATVRVIVYSQDLSQLRYLTGAPADAVAGGICGEDMRWKLTDDGVLTFSGTGRMSAYYREENPWYEYRSQINTVVVEEGITTLSDFVFYNFPSLTSVSLPEGLIYMGWSTFEKCAALSEITFPSTFVNLDETVLANCPSLKKVTFTGDAPQISPEAFNKTSATVYYPAENETWENVIDKNYGGNLIWIPVEQQVIGGICGENVTWGLYDGMLFISGEGSMYDYTTSSPDYNSWEHVWETFNEEGNGNGDGAANRNRIKMVIIVDGVTSIAEGVFSHCYNLTEVIIPPSVRSISRGAFDTEVEPAVTREIVFYGGKPFPGGAEYPISDYVGRNAAVYYPVYERSWDDVNANAADDSVTLIPFGYFCDVNADKEVTNSDLILTARYIVDLLDPDSMEARYVKSLADTDDNGIITNADLIFMARYLVGLEQILPMIYVTIKP